jgi:hypothetical protein
LHRSVIHGRLRLDAQQHIVRRGVVAPGVVHVVGRDHRHAHLVAELELARDDLRLPLEAVVHQLEVHVVAPEDIERLPEQVPRPVQVLREQVFGHPSLLAGRHRDEALVVAIEELPVHARLVVEALQVRRRHQLHQVPVALLVLRQ